MPRVSFDIVRYLPFPLCLVYNSNTLNYSCALVFCSPICARAGAPHTNEASLLNVLGPAQAQATIDLTIDLAQLELLPHGDRDEGHRLDDDLAHEKRRALLVEGVGHLARVCERKGSGLGMRLGSGMPLGLGLGVSAR